MTVSLCIRQGLKINDDSVSVEELDWSAESQLNTSGVTLNADLEPRTHHQTPMTCTYGTVISYTSKLLLQERGFLYQGDDPFYQQPFYVAEFTSAFGFSRLY